MFMLCIAISWSLAVCHKWQQMASNAIDQGPVGHIPSRIAIARARPGMTKMVKVPCRINYGDLRKMGVSHGAEIKNFATRGKGLCGGIIFRFSPPLPYIAVLCQQSNFSQASGPTLNSRLPAHTN
jgi:hypothetical protein